MPKADGHRRWLRIDGGSSPPFREHKVKIEVTPKDNDQRLWQSDVP